jgi:hypothetical protein
MKRISRRTRQLLGLAGGLVALSFALGYRLPGVDQHPDWPPFRT